MALFFGNEFNNTITPGLVSVGVFTVGGVTPGAGADILDGGGGADFMNGGDGNDTYFVDNLGDTVVEANVGAVGGIDIVNSMVSFTLSAAIENLFLIGAGNSGGTGNAKNNVIRGNSGSNDLLGLAGNDTIMGGENGNDRLIGGDGNDVLLDGLGLDILEGGNGADTMAGGAGADTLIGGLGNDVFDFNVASHSTPANTDVIQGGGGAVAFQNPGAAVGDLIDLSGIDADTATAADDAFIFGGVGVGHLSLVNFGGNTFVRGNTTAGGGFEFQVEIQDGGVMAAAYTAADFDL